MQTINIGLIGVGTVGGGVVKILSRKLRSFQENLGLPLRLARIADRAVERFQTLPVGDAVCSADADDVLDDPAIDIVVELIGGTTIAREVVLKALARGKHVITANKALIAEHGPALFDAAEKAGRLALLRGLGRRRHAGHQDDPRGTGRERRGLDQDHHQRDLQLHPHADGGARLGLHPGAGRGPAPRLRGGRPGPRRRGQRRGAQGRHHGARWSTAATSPYERMPIEGVTSITAEDIAVARELGYCIKLLGIIRKNPQDQDVDVRVHPTMLHRDHILASVSGVFNAVLLEGDAVGPILLYGRGAGELPTASAVVSDIVDVARNILSGTPCASRWTTTTTTTPSPWRR